MENLPCESRYDLICKQEFTDIKDRLEVIHTGLFIDKNGKCLQSKVNDNEKVVKILSGVMIAVGLAIVGLIGNLVYMHFKG